MAITDTLIPAVDISDKQTVPVTLNGKNILICKANGEFYAVDNQCTHQRAELTGGRIARVIPREQHHAGLRRGDLRLVTRVAKETEVARTGLRECGEAADLLPGSSPLSTGRGDRD